MQTQSLGFGQGMWRAPAAGLAESAYRLSRVLESRSLG